MKTTTKKEAKKNNSMAMEAILEGLTDIQKKNIRKCSSLRNYGLDYNSIPIKNKKQRLWN